MQHYNKIFKTWFAGANSRIFSNQTIGFELQFIAIIEHPENQTQTEEIQIDDFVETVYQWLKHWPFTQNQSMNY